MNGAGTANAPSLPTPVDPVPDHPMRRGYMIIQRLLLPVFLTAALACGTGLASVPDSPPAAKPVDPESLPGAQHYHSHCAKCHEGTTYKAPARTFIAMMSPDAIYGALTTGVMQSQGAALSSEQKREVAEYLSGETLNPAAPPAQAPLCTGKAAQFDLGQPPRLTAWGLDSGNSHHVPGDVAALNASDVPRLKLKWAFAYPGALRARSQPNFAMGALYVGSQNGTVYALDAASGCVRWTFRATAEVRTPVVIPSWSAASSAPARPLAYFGDIVGRAYAVDARTGELVWKHRVDDHAAATITGAPVYHAGKLYVPVSSLEEAATDPTYPCCTFRGSVVALDAATGKEVWKTYTIPTPPRQVGKTSNGTAIYAPSGAPVWNSPTLDLKRGLLYVGTGDNYSSPSNDRSDAILAFDLKSGALRWHWQVFGDDAWNVGCMLHNDNCPKPSGPDFDLGSGTMLVTLPSGKDVILGGLKSGSAFAVDPDTHKSVLWTSRLGRGGTQGGIQFGMAADAGHLYVPISDNGLKVDPDYPGEPHPGLYALNAATGALEWSHPAPNRCNGEKYCDPGILAAITSIPGAVFAGHMDGMVRAYDAASGDTLWEYDTRPPVTSVSGASAHGGSIGGGGPVVYNGMLYVNSGYALYFHLPGNVLYAFSVDGK